jgi:hypothetical protein
MLPGDSFVMMLGWLAVLVGLGVLIAGIVARPARKLSR